MATESVDVQHLTGSERLAALRDAVARIEAASGLPHGRRIRREAERHRPARIGLGEGGLDAMLGGGLRRGTLHEIVAAHRQDDGAAVAFGLALAIRCAGRGPLVWIVEDCAVHETGLPYRPGLAGHGLDPDRLILVRTREAQTTLWAFEEALRLAAPVVLAELWGSRHYGLVASRRLLLAAQAGRGTALLLHTGLSGQAADLSSVAETRLSVAAAPSHRTASAGDRMPIPGAAAFGVRVLKQRLGAAPGFDSDLTHTLVWNAAQRCFDDHPLSVDLPAPLADRPHRAGPDRAGPNWAEPDRIARWA